MKLILFTTVLLLTTACSFDINVRDSKHTIEHVVTVEIPKELLAICDNVEDEEARKVCISEISDEFMDAIKKLLEEANALEN